MRLRGYSWFCTLWSPLAFLGDHTVLSTDFLKPLSKCSAMCFPQVAIVKFEACHLHILNHITFGFTLKLLQTLRHSISIYFLPHPFCFSSFVFIMLSSSFITRVALKCILFLIKINHFCIYLIK